MTSEYEVGYGKPPKHSQFKPGNSGNPKGRPKGARGRPALTIQLEIKIVLSDGVEQRGSTSTTEPDAVPGMNK